MPAKSGASHAAAAFLSIIIGVIISNYLAAHGGVLNAISVRVGRIITGLIGIEFPSELVGLIIISTFLAFLWGIAYHYARNGGGSRGKNNVYADKYNTENRTMSAESLSRSGTADAGQHAYRTLKTVKAADEELSAKLQREFDEAKSRLDDIHDRCYDAGNRKYANHVTSVINSVTNLERVATQVTRRLSDVDQVAERPVDTHQQDLAGTHERLVKRVAELGNTIRDVHETSSEPDEEFFHRCDLLVRDIERALNSREDVVEQLGEST